MLLHGFDLFLDLFDSVEGMLRLLEQLKRLVLDAGCNTVVVAQEQRCD
ncbi:hypothetical protein HOU71_gp46 [Pectobacterium phage Clickz]|uniref:Uncharacterized protein n=8 Tax=Phimunavirus Clickz TaxID=2733338 RepID=A0A3G8FH93_9CAUD|nr:hypothetical protein HOU71_gp46 [Pectobacterium phage Clickz]AZF94105.1 hypothetical protein [Pectobacterium phage Clickz_B2]AZF94203.1 hypothetical protein [Pectobacterium phage Clickz_B3]AZF94229.1 hypothetical protein [Pectobacterium phage Clickz_B4]AZF94291.1 hypothetical protein [Pectobacterium phage Clickz_B5]AZF94331.1 hypothetical protein [Pectobacterium phage Clickz_B6]AZF94386.1 hypothetical protein [Pectobacterium phage Clickz_B7]AZF94470.1 hypothetical protein [Pectobacterium 